ncbi:FAD binding domain-containing protein [Mycolicibacterium alvei]|uniref:Carbon monoxide dehydrogenase n=1 Tax=Mycolicibacterium alvei TaxID=67081 RepID=A0A6N4UVK9_9MYCO|nr:FAD binding domain-containing protein [Mycolicibacterium alvei]MCV7003925.1 FAD binding domain-containing protein [Mycolicibacterium alvei]BBX27684.1 carbon monoxide dehydrogenase [Mycolicibacterium alvei]
MRPAPFDYVAATTVEEACAELGRDPDGTRVLAGGQSLMPRMVRRQERPRCLIDITRIAELHELSTTEGDLRVGAAVTQRTAEMFHALSGFGVLAQALPRVGKVTTRNRGTICGSLANANPAAELGVCLLVTGGEITAISTRGVRHISAENFFLAPRRTALADDELLHTVRFNRPDEGIIGHFDEVTIRGAGDTPLLSAAVSARIDGDGVSDVRIGVGGEGQQPVLAPTDITAALAGSLDDAAIEHAGRSLATGLDFSGDARGSADHRQRLAINVVGRLLRRLREDLP